MTCNLKVHLSLSCLVLHFSNNVGTVGPIRANGGQCPIVQPHFDHSFTFRFTMNCPFWEGCVWCSGEGGRGVCSEENW